ncbi:Permease of the drug/metabolite transporter (DMT) superfamily [Ferrimonas sediminum]|uniref:Permease of the drug/metabolite transporter (DMT) superfamily n=1 Tax=Ferrimonas sediminum TaxID=718193 RepID=A0A1G9B0U4_9GAMM|nr:DMT family transporter [Ferrimonas sediminum]SDK33147.1 Permease of the drug/metabolite transporter (DMT) superfamily [Ferrimonas sediminum]
MKGRTAEMALIVAMILWASSFIALKVAFESYDPWTVIAGRMWVACLCFAFFWPKLFNFQYRKGDWKILLVMAAVEPSLYFILEGLALQYTSASQAGMVTSLAPLLTAIVAFIVLKERITKVAAVGLCIAIVGVMVLGSSGDVTESAPNPMLGNTLELAAMLCAAIFSVCLKLLSERYSALTLTAYMSAVGAVFFTPLALLKGGPWHFSVEPIVSIVFLGAFVTLGGYLLYNYAIAHMPVSRASMFVNLIPVFTVILAYLILDERLNQTQLMASVVVMLGVGLSQIKPRKSAETQSQPS